MRRAPILFLLTLAACGDPAPRDRTVVARLTPPPPGRAVEAPFCDALQPGRWRPPEGLAADPLAPLYPRGALFILRFEDPARLIREAFLQCREVAELLPMLQLPESAPTDLVREFLGLPDTIGFDPRLPFALARLDGGWIGILPTPHRYGETDRIRPLDEVYCVAGDPALLARYEPVGRSGVYLPGDCSLLLGERGLPAVAASIRRYFAALGLPAPLPFRGRLALPEGVKRVDLAIRFGQAGMRLDLRVGARPDSDLARRIALLRPSRPTSERWLPDDGTLYFDVGSRPESIAGFRGLPAGPGVRLFQGDIAAMLDLDPDGSGTLLLLARLRDPAAARRWLSSPAAAVGFAALGQAPDGLAWEPDAYERGGAGVGRLRGKPSEMLLGRLAANGVLGATLATRLRGDLVAHVAVVGERLCIVIGERSRAEIDQLMDRLRTGEPAPTSHSRTIERLYPQRIASFSVDLAALYDGTRDPASRSPGGEDAPSRLALQWKLPASGAVTVQGNALHAALRIRPRRMAAAAARIIEAAAGPEERD